MKLVLTLCFLFHVHAHSRNQNVRKLTPSEPREEAAINKKARKRDVGYDGLERLFKLTFGLTFSEVQSVYSATHETMWWQVGCPFEYFKNKWTRYDKVSQEYKAYKNFYDVLIKLGKGEMSMASAKRTLMAEWLKLSPALRAQLRYDFSGFALTVDALARAKPIILINFVSITCEWF